MRERHPILKENILGDNASSNIEILKWIGIVAMTFDHTGTLFLVEHDIFRMIGRLAFPIFGFVLIYNFIYHTKNKAKYIKRLALFTFLFEPIHFLVFKHHYAGMNIFLIYTLTLSLLYLFELLQEDKFIRTDKKVFFILYLVLSIYAAQYTEYSISGFLLIISFYFSIKYRRYLFITILLLILLNAPSLKYLLLTFDYTNHLFYLSAKLDFKYIAPTLTIVPIIYIVSKININIPRSRYFFYLYYPVHILFLNYLKLNLVLIASATKL